MADPSLHWYIVTIEQTMTAHGYQIVVTTNQPAHLTLRWTSTVPQKHFLPIMRRGATVGTLIDQCFVAYTDVPQDEPGDTLVHTFFIEPWPVCEWRWFYFWGTVAGKASPSLSPIYEKHRVEPTYGPPQTADFKPQPGISDTAIDAHCRAVAGPDGSWASIHGATYSTPINDYYVIQAGVYAGNTPDTWTWLWRGIISVDLSTIPPGSLFEAAALHTTKQQNYRNFDLVPSYALFPAAPDDPGHIVSGDYARVGATPLTLALDYNEIAATYRPIFIFNSDGLDYLQGGRVNSLSLRNANWDAPNIEPPWFRRTNCNYYAYSADNTNRDRDPFYRITWREPL